MQTPESGFISVENENHQSPVHVLPGNTLNVPVGNVVMVSFSDFERLLGGRTHLRVYTRTKNESEITLWATGRDYHTDVFIYDVGNIALQWKKYKKVFSWRPRCFTMLFSFHAKNNIPKRLSSGLYNCSVDDYWRFQQHLDCNLKVECEDGRDESGHCPYSSPACQGWVAARDKCYTFVSHEKLQAFASDKQSFIAKAAQYCASINASISQPKTHDDVSVMLEAFTRIKYRRVIFIVVGLFYGALSTPDIYRAHLVADDRTVLYYTLTNHLLVTVYTGEKMCIGFKLNTPGLSTMPCSRLEHVQNACITCEMATMVNGNHDDELRDLTFPDISSSFKTPKEGLTRCSNGEVTHVFLTSYPYTACPEEIVLPCVFSNCSSSRTTGLLETRGGANEPMSLLEVYMCGDDVTRLPYTLVCDFRHDCQDGGDESFCQHPTCDGFTCNNGQCVSYINRCDIVSDCIDDSDEMYCAGQVRIRNAPELNRQSPVLIKFDGLSAFCVENMDSAEACPDTHYRCLGDHNDCLPVYTLCNGWHDCMDHGDETGCEEMVCPGLYRCFNSTVCLNVDHLCDGWPHCPQRDDEWLCDVTCPAQCLCHGHAFVCPRPFPAHLYHQLRFLNARGSGMRVTDLGDQQYMVKLILSLCSLTTLSVVSLPNLQFLDLSVNQLRVIDMTVFAGLSNLRTLSLAKNPIYLLHMHNEPLVAIQQVALTVIDLSYSNLTVFDSEPLSVFPFVRTLNLSFSPIHTVGGSGFQHTPSLTNLYMEGVIVKSFPMDILKPLTKLRSITGQTYKLCCKQILPRHFDLISCNVPSDEISSCEDLLQLQLYRAFLWLISFMSLLGNLFCLVARTLMQRNASVGGFHVFVTNLCVADLFMGIYIAIIGVADALFRGKYLHYDEMWMHSAACKAAGFLSLLSSEVSALTILLITLDRFVVLHFPFSTVRLQKTSATVVCLLAWLIGCILAAVPLLPMASSWHFFSQAGICVPLPVTRQDFKGRVYSVGIFIVLNFVLFIFIAMGQAFIYWSVQKNALKTDSTRVSRDLNIARRLITVAVTDFLCWFPIGVCGLLASADIPIPGEANVGFAIFALPLNSALNPFIYTFNVVLEKRRKSREALLFKWLEIHRHELEN